MPKELRRSSRQRKQLHDNLEGLDDLEARDIENNPAILNLMNEANDRLNEDEAGTSRNTRRKRAYIDEDEDETQQHIETRRRPTRACRREVVSLNLSGPVTVESDGEEGTEEILDIYSRVKRRRRPTSFFRVEDDEDNANDSVASNTNRHKNIKDDEEYQEEEEEEDEEPNDGNNSTDSELSVEEQMKRRYFLREHKPKVKRFAVALPEPKARNMESPPPPERRLRPRHRNNNNSNNVDSMAFRSPAHKRYKRRTKRKRKLDHDGSSTSSSSGSEDDRGDQKRFERRTAKSLDRAKQRFLPLNITSADATRGILRDRMRTGASCSDIDPMAIDKQVGFDSIGGLNAHVQSLKEMVLFPLLYPQVFEKFNIAPPRGVVFYGPPGTGKTLVARALANECSQGERKVAFFMRKGADCLSKWVGESERQLRLLFDQAYTMRPSIIFFDEIDGLAPVRSTRQDQIHSSIVSTLLALMDGLDQRGEVVVIGATNRLDSLDPALRRPGRFDREFAFSLPDRNARRDILQIHTKTWQPPLDNILLEELADKTVGFCGADIKGICTEAALVALRKRYPQIYCSEQKLQLDLQSIVTNKEDFEVALRKLQPASQRTLDAPIRPLSKLTTCLLGSSLQTLISNYIPRGFHFPKSAATQGPKDQYESVLACLQTRAVVAGGRVLVCGSSSAFGQSSHVAPALLHSLDHLAVHSLSLANVFAVSSHRSPEEAVAEILQAAGRGGSRGACVLYLPAIDQWETVVTASVWHTLISVLETWDAFTSVLLLATAHCSSDHLSDDIRCIFRSTETFELPSPTVEERKAFLEKILLEQCLQPPEQRTVRYAALPVANTVQPRQLSDAEIKALRKQEEGLLRQLRIFLREMLGRLIRDRRFTIFSKAVDPEDAPDYGEIIKNPMDLSMMMAKIDRHEYGKVADFLGDINLITQNALEYNPDRDQTDKMIRHRACALRDTAYALIDTELDPDFEHRLQEIRDAKSRRGDPRNLEHPPPFLVTVPAPSKTPSSVDSNSRSSFPGKSRYSTRSHGPAPEVAEVPPDLGHKIVTVQSPKDKEEPVKNHNSSATQNKRKPGPRGSLQSIWCRPKRKRASLQRKRQVLHRQSSKIIKKYKAQKRLFTTASSSSSQRSSPKEPFVPEPESVSLPEPLVEEPLEPLELELDRDRLESLVQKGLDKTEGYTVAELDRLAANCMQIIDGYKSDWYRNPMIEELELLFV